jgi:hypothetical protein
MPDHVGRPGTNHVAALVGKMPDMDKVRRLSKPDRSLAGAEVFKENVGQHPHLARG